MSEAFVGQGEYLSFELVGAEHIDETVSDYGETLHYDGLLLSLVIENISNSICYWDRDEFEIVDANGFAYSIKDSEEYYHLEQLIPGGWYVDLDKLQPNRKYRYVVFIDDFHGELGLISYEAKHTSLLHSSDPDALQKSEQVEIDISSAPSHDVGGVPELRDIFTEK
ncbi:hypothetical protein [Halobellus rufus]|uniref:hypothetical protein n=1 Tax=Halobellus rufus TaxID=1448860 RepID=UPI0012E0B3DF|nr:hypothetical protein [Halobellus rufus]